MRRVKFAVLAAISLLGACVFESAAPLIPDSERATPLVAGAYSMLERKNDGAFEKQSDVTLALDAGGYTLTSADGVMNFALYRVSPNIYVAQLSEKPDENVYSLLETSTDGAAITNLPCSQLNSDERARFHLAPSDKASCVFTTLDDLVTAALYLKGRGETPSLRLVKQN